MEYIWTETIRPDFGFKPCRVCHGLSKTLCPLCGQMLKRVMDMSDVEKIKYQAHKERMVDLKNLWLKLRNLKLLTSGCDEADEAVRLHFGPWWK